MCFFVVVFFVCFFLVWKATQSLSSFLAPHELMGSLIRKVRIRFLPHQLQERCPSPDSSGSTSCMIHSPFLAEMHQIRVSVLSEANFAASNLLGNSVKLKGPAARQLHR